MGFTRRFQLIVGLAAILALIGLGVSLFLRPTTPLAYSLVEQTTLSVLKGRVEYLPSGESAWRTAKGGEVLNVGDRITTGPDSHGLITFFEGTTAEIEPGTEVRITRLEKPETAGQVELGFSQYVGTTWNRVARIADVQSRMEIDTPTAVAMVRGTEFEVTVGSDRKTEVATSQGLVELTAEGQTVPVEAGFLSVVEPGKPPAPPVPAPPPRRTLSITLHRAGRLFATDSKGRSVGFFPWTGSYVSQIPGAWYSGSRSEPQVIVLPEPGERYRIVISPGSRASQTGDYSGAFLMSVGLFEGRTLVSVEELSETIGALEVGTYDLRIPGDGIQVGTLTRTPWEGSEGRVAPQVMARRELSQPDPLLRSKSAEDLMKKVSESVRADPPPQYRVLVEGLKSRNVQPGDQARAMEKVLRDASAQAALYVQKLEKTQPEVAMAQAAVRAVATLARTLALTPIRSATVVPTAGAVIGGSTTPPRTTSTPSVASPPTRTVPPIAADGATKMPTETPPSEAIAPTALPTRALPTRATPESKPTTAATTTSAPAVELPVAEPATHGPEEGDAAPDDGSVVVGTAVVKPPTATAQPPKPTIDAGAAPAPSPSAGSGVGGANVSPTIDPKPTPVPLPTLAPPTVSPTAKAAATATAPADAGNVPAHTPVATATITPRPIASATTAPPPPTRTATAAPTPTAKATATPTSVPKPTPPPAAVPTDAVVRPRGP